VLSRQPQRALEIFEARRGIEPSVSRFAAEQASTCDIRILKAHLKREEKANKRGDRRAAIRLSGQFHVEVVNVARNEVMEIIVKELVTRTSLIIGMFGAPGTSNCILYYKRSMAVG
jgi:DNA-binding GntR family transcriptional regulator